MEATTTRALVLLGANGAMLAFNAQALIDQLPIEGSTRLVATALLVLSVVGMACAYLMLTSKRNHGAFEALAILAFVGPLVALIRLIWGINASG